MNEIKRMQELANVVDNKADTKIINVNAPLS
jgi:hypothetical protein